MSALPPTDPPAVPEEGSPFLKAAVDTLKLVIGMAATPGGLSLATTILGVANPAILLVEQFGVRILAPLLATWTAPDITDEDVTANLTVKGRKVEPYDPMAGWR